MKPRKVKFYRYPHPYNVGDTITPYILRFFRPDLEFYQVPESYEEKILLVGSVMRVIKKGDTIIGAGVMRKDDEFPQAKDCKFLAVRGKMSRDILKKNGGNVPSIYGDPALLLPLMYNPGKVLKIYKVGIVPHFADKGLLLRKGIAENLARTKDYKIIDICQDYTNFVNEIMTCKKIIGSSLHGLIIAEAYGIPVEWAKLSCRVLGDGFKFKDYLTGTGRKPIEEGKFPKLQKETLKKIQSGLLKAINQI